MTKPPPLPSTHFTPSPFARHIFTLSCTCGWTTLYTHRTHPPSPESLAAMNRVVEIHYSTHLPARLHALRVHGTADPTPLPKLPAPRLRATSRSRLSPSPTKYRLELG